MKIKKKFGRFSITDRYKYHSQRDRNPGKFGLKSGSPKNAYSAGFVDAFHRINNSSAMKGEFGKRAEKSYNHGHRRGTKAAQAYTVKTGLPSFKIDYQ